MRYKFLFLLALFTALQTIHSQDITSGLVGHWPLDGDARDISGNNYNGITMQNVTQALDRFSKNDGALNFIGKSYIDFGDILDMGTKNMSFSAWVKYDKINSGYNTILGKYTNTQESSYGIGFSSHKAAAMFDAGQRKYFYGSIWDDKDWHFLVVVFDRNVLAKIYVDGTLERQVDISYGANIDIQNSHHFILGSGRRRDGNYYLGFHGTIDDVRAYDRVLSIEDINTLYQMEEAPSVSFINPPVERKGSFQLEKGEKYVVSCWVSEPETPAVASYERTKLGISFDGGTSVELYGPSGAIIDGWQQIVGEFMVPIDATGLEFSLLTTHDSGSSYFDDLRIFPFEGNMKSFVYDPVTQRLVAELDEQNFATFYEYDKEGGLVRVKKETGKGVYTIQESRSSNAKN